jgi:hypothetical protein
MQIGSKMGWLCLARNLGRPGLRLRKSGNEGNTSRRVEPGEAVDLIVHHDVEQVNVPAHTVHEVIATDAEAVTVAASHEYGQIVIRKLRSRRHIQSLPLNVCMP